MYEISPCGLHKSWAISAAAVWSETRLSINIWSLKGSGTYKAPCPCVGVPDPPQTAVSGLRRHCSAVGLIVTGSLHRGPHRKRHFSEIHFGVSPNLSMVYPAPRWGGGPKRESCYFLTHHMSKFPFFHVI